MKLPPVGENGSVPRGASTLNRNNHDSARDPISLLAGVASGSLLGILSPNLAPFEVGALISQMHIGERQVGVLVTTELMTVSVVALVSAPIFTRASCATFAIVGLVISVVGQGATIYAFDFPTMMMARSIAGVGLGMAYAAANARRRLSVEGSTVAPARIGLLLAVLAIFNLGAGAVWSFFERIGVRHGMSADAIGWLAGISACVGIVGALLVSWVAPRFNRTAPSVCAEPS